MLELTNPNNASNVTSLVEHNRLSCVEHRYCNCDNIFSEDLLYLDMLVLNFFKDHCVKGKFDELEIVPQNLTK